MEQVTDLTMQELFDNPSAFVGQLIRIEGIVDHVCPSKTKLALISDDGNHSIEVTTDGEFKDYLATKRIMVKGVLKEVIVDEAFLEKKRKEIDKIQDPDLKQHAEENYRKLKKKVESSDEPVKKYLLESQQVEIIGCE